MFELEQKLKKAQEKRGSRRALQGFELDEGPIRHGRRVCDDEISALLYRNE